MVSEVRAREYDASEARSRGARIEDGAMGRPAPCTAVGVAKEREEIIRLSSCWQSRFAFELRPYKFRSGDWTGIAGFMSVKMIVGSAAGRIFGPLIKSGNREIIRTARCCEGFPVHL